MSNYQKDYISKFNEQYTFGLINVQDLTHRIAVYAEYVNVLEEYKKLAVSLTNFEQALGILADVEGITRGGK